MATPSPQAERREMDMKRGGPNAELHQYLVSKCFRGTEELVHLQKISREHRRGGMLSPPDSVAILQLFTKMTQAKVAIEVGVFTGYTALGIALALPENGKLYACDIERTFTDVGKPYWEKAGVAHKIDLKIAPALDTLKALLKELGPDSVDLAFVDADKSNYVNYYELLIQLIRPGGVILIDNVLWAGRILNDSDQTPDTQGIRAINDLVYTDRRVQPAILKNSDGITVAYKL